MDTEANVQGYLDSMYTYWEGYFHYGAQVKLDHPDLGWGPVTDGDVSNTHDWGIGSFQSNAGSGYAHPALDETLYFLSWDPYDWTVSNQVLYSIVLNDTGDPWQGDDTLGDTGLFYVDLDNP